MSDDRTPERPGEPSADAIEALVRSIAARETGRPVLEARRPVVGAGRPAGGRPDATTFRRAAGGPTAPATHARSPISRLDWERLVADESERVRRYGRPSAIVVAEIAGLDRVVAQAGPAVGGRVAPPCGKTLAAIARASDPVTRLGETRFGILLRETNADGAACYAARAVAACDPWLGAMPWPLRLIAGWATPAAGDDLASALRTAERRLAAATATQRRDRP